MTKGIPDNTRSNYGITYLNKTDAQDHASGMLTVRDRQALGAEAANKQPKSPTAGMASRPHPKLFGQARESIGESGGIISAQAGRKFSDKPDPKAVATTSTRTQFTNPNFVSQRIEPLPTGQAQPVAGKKPKGGAKPDHELTDISETGTGSYSPSDSLGGRSSASERKIEAKHKVPRGKDMREGTGQGKGSAGHAPKGQKNLPRQVGDAPKGTKYEKELIGGRNTRVGVGSTAHSKFQKRGGVGEAPAGKPKSEEEQAAEHKDRKIRYARSEVGRLERKEMFDKLTGIKSKAQLTIIKAQLLKVTAERYVRPSMASAGKKPATKMPNAGGIQDKLDMMSADSKNSTPDANTETSVTGSDKKVSDRYS